MARFADVDSSRVKIDETVERWKEQCLLKDGSLLFDDRPIWTAANLTDFRDRFLGEAAIYGGDLNFEQKLEKQLETASVEVRWLACEVLAVYFLFARIAISGDAKVGILDRVREPAGEDGDPPHWPLVRDAMYEGIGNPGGGYNIRRDFQVGYLIDFARRWKGLPADEQAQLLEDSWALRDFADQPEDDMPTREMRHILLHLLRADDFERISSRTHKQQIVDAFRGEFLDGEDGAPEDLDEQLLFIRGKLEELDAQPDAHNGILDFYRPPLSGIWAPGNWEEEGASDLDLLLYKKQLVFFGAPGTSKTHRTRELAAALIRRVALERGGAKKFFEDQEAVEKACQENVEWIQLHPGYGYEEFIRGLRLDGDKTVYVPGVLPQLVEKISAQDNDPLPFVLVLDEINRADLSRMFGEAFSLLESRDRPARLPGRNPGEEPEELTLPDDLYVIGTMNLIDQSVEQLDFALRRRFFWRPCGFQREPIIEVNRNRWADFAPKRYGWERAEDDIGQLADRAVELNAQIEASPHLGPQYVIGHTYYFDAAYFGGRWLQGRKMLQGGPFWTRRGKPQPPLEDLWTLSLEPVLAQYLEGIASEESETELERLRSVLMDGAAE
jgi:5-methylcytosine-specific restriction protein B